MSRSNNTEVISPVTRTFEWSGKSGCIKYFDKDRGEKGEDVTVQLPFGFIVLDKLATITGFSDADNSGFWSNEVRNTKTDILTVRTKKGIVQEGLYADLAKAMKEGAKYCQALYIAYYDEEKVLQIGKFKVSGSAIGSWIESSKGVDLYKVAVKIVDKVPKKKGTNDYWEPVYKFTPVSEEADTKAIELDKVVQEYLKSYFARNSEAPTPAPIENEVTAESLVRDSQKQQGVDATNNFYHQSRVNSGSGTNYSDGSDLTEPLDDLPF